MSEQKRSQDFHFEFHHTWGGEENPFDKWKRWAAKKPFPISFLLGALISTLEMWVIEGKVKREMHRVDMQAEKLKREWDVKEKKKPKIKSRPSAVKGLDEISISSPYYKRVEGDWLAEDPNSWYQGPLEVFEIPEEGFGERQTDPEDAK